MGLIEFQIWVEIISNIIISIGVLFAIYKVWGYIDKKKLNSDRPKWIATLQSNSPHKGGVSYNLDGTHKTFHIEEERELTEKEYRYMKDRYGEYFKFKKIKKWN